MKYANTQSYAGDMFLESALIDIHSPTRIVELGACFGGWAVYINQTLPLSSAHFTMIESFFGREWDRSKSDDEKKNLLDKILKKKMTAPYEILTGNPVDLITPGYDVFRYDAYSDYATFEKYINNASDNSLIIIHDFNFNCEVGPVFYTMKYALEHELYPIWFGKLSTVWTKNKNYKTHITEKFLDTYGVEQLRDSWLMMGQRPEYHWDAVDQNFLDYQYVLTSQ